MTRRIKTLAVTAGILAAGVALLKLSILAACHILLFLFTL